MSILLPASKGDMSSTDIEKKIPDTKTKMQALAPPWDHGPNPYAKRSADASRISFIDSEPLLIKFDNDVI